MTGSHFLLPFREKVGPRALSSIALTIALALSLVYIIVSPTLLAILVIYLISLTFFLANRALFLRTVRVVLTAYIIIFFLGLPSLFFREGSIVLSIPIGRLAITLYSAGVERAIFIWVRGLFSVSIVALYTTTLTVQEFIQALRSLFMPSILVTLILLILRYTPLLNEQGREVRVAQELRGISSAPWRRRFAAAASLLGGTLIRSVRRGSEVYEAMVLRGLESSDLVRSIPIKWLDLLIIPILASLFSFIAGGILAWIL